MKDIAELFREAQEYGFIGSEIHRQESDIVIGTIETDDLAKMLHTLATLFLREVFLLKRKEGSLTWESLLLKTRAEMCKSSFMERVIVYFGEISQEKATENNISDYTLEVRNQWEVVISPKNTSL